MRLGPKLGDTGCFDGAVVEMFVGAIEVDGWLVVGMAEGVVGVIELGTNEGNIFDGVCVGL